MSSPLLLLTMALESGRVWGLELSIQSRDLKKAARTKLPECYLPAILAGRWVREQSEN